MKRNALTLACLMVLLFGTLTTPAAAQVEVPGSCTHQRIGLSDRFVVENNTCFGTLDTPCFVKVTAEIGGRRNASGKEASVSSSCGSETASATAEVPGGLSNPFGGIDEESDTSGKGSPKGPCIFDPPGGGALTIWRLTCEYTFDPAIAIE